MKKTITCIFASLSVSCWGAVAAPPRVEVVKASFDFLARNRLKESDLRKVGCVYESTDEDIAGEIATWLKTRPVPAGLGKDGVDPRLLIRTGSPRSELWVGSAESDRKRIGERDGRAVLVSNDDLKELYSLLDRMTLKSAGAHC